MNTLQYHTYLAVLQSGPASKARGLNLFLKMPYNKATEFIKEKNIKEKR